MPDRRLAGLIALLLLSTLAACEAADDAARVEDAGPRGPASTFRYVREYVFVGSRADTPFVVPFSFHATPADRVLDRQVRAWLARGATWEQFLDESFRTGASSGVWRVLPHGPLRLAAGGPAEVEALWYQRGTRRLRLDLGAPLSDWTRGEDVRYRVDQASLRLGEETIRGVALEVLRVERSDAGSNAADALMLTSGDSLRLLLAEAMGAAGERGGVGWMRTPEGERHWDDAEVRWLEVASFQEARRDIPIRWSFRVPQAAVHGQVEALGYTVVVGEERAGRRALEARYTVRGWVEREGQRNTVTGVLRHHQR